MSGSEQYTNYAGVDEAALRVKGVLDQMDIDAQDRQGIINQLAQFFQGAAGSENDILNKNLQTALNEHHSAMTQLKGAINAEVGSGGEVDKNDKLIATFFTP